MKAYEILMSHDWCKGAFARTASGESVGSQDPGAVSFCLLGAIGKAYSGSDSVPGAIAELSKLLPADISFTRWNDEPSRTKEEVLEVLRRAGV
jgi:hypothetical protein